MKFEEAGKAIDIQLANLVEYLDKNVKPATKKDMAGLLKKASKQLSKMAASLEKASR